MSFSKEMIDAVWQRAEQVQNNDPNVYRKDQCSAWIRKAEYGNRDSAYGWEIDHINPHGGDNLGNLQPLNWHNNVAKSDGVLKCVVISNSTQNVRR